MDFQSAGLQFYRTGFVLDVVLLFLVSQIHLPCNCFVHKVGLAKV